MASYEDFALVYDQFMDNISYEEWAKFIIGQLKKEHINEGIVLDLACGTGILTELLSESGYDMIGVDSSEEMLSIAREKQMEAGKTDILYLEQDIRSFELYGTVKAIVCVCDSLNYITKKDELFKVFSLVKNYLDPDGIFIFDINSEYKYEKILGDNTFAESREDCAFIWDNFYDEDTKINEYDLTLFIKEDDTFARSVETHLERAYSLDEIYSLLGKAELEVLAIYDDYSRDYVTRKSERITFVVKNINDERKMKLLENQ
ncbi:MAG: class I SAM-dependent methyltransferase [Lachnospiraceae bacterium]|jgi:SAM-dependent methyltransferase|nr:class I SAM-dependent methyltransferase [Lachnospiraceae bacterium]